jgi:hypothetical protein
VRAAKGFGEPQGKKKGAEVSRCHNFFENERVDGRSNGVSLFFLKTLRTDRGIA